MTCGKTKRHSALFDVQNVQNADTAGKKDMMGGTTRGNGKTQRNAPVCGTSPAVGQRSFG
jgi:hypothetical protein